MQIKFYSRLTGDLGPQKMMYFGSFILIPSSLFVFTIGRFPTGSYGKARLDQPGFGELFFLRPFPARETLEIARRLWVYLADAEGYSCTEAQIRLAAGGDN